MERVADVVPLPARRDPRRGRSSFAVDVSLVIPAYNEARRLPATLDRLNAWVTTVSLCCEVIVVDDGSVDATAAAAANHAMRCGVVRLLENRGKGAAVRTGMLEASGRVIAFTDADLPYAMDALETAVTMIDGGRVDAVYGARDLRESALAVRRTVSRSLASSSFRVVTSLFVSRHIRDTQCGLKAFSRRAAHEIFSRVHTDGFAFDAEAILVARRLGFAAARVPVVLVNEAGSTVSLRRHAPQMLRDIVRSRMRHGRAAGPKLAAAPPYEVICRADVGVIPVRRAA